jgi:hypothetical protein
MSSKHLCLASYTWPLSQTNLALRGNSEKSMEDICIIGTSSENIKKYLHEVLKQVEKREFGERF